MARSAAEYLRRLHVNFLQRCECEADGSTGTVRVRDFHGPLCSVIQRPYLNIIKLRYRICLGRTNESAAPQSDSEAGGATSTTARSPTFASAICIRQWRICRSERHSSMQDATGVRISTPLGSRPMGLKSGSGM